MTVDILIYSDIEESNLLTTDNTFITADDTEIDVSSHNSDPIVFKGYDRIDLFDDENININLTAKNISNIATVFTDYTQTFTIPCSPQNNKIFKHFYDTDLDNGFNANIRANAVILIDTLVFRTGKVQLEKVTFKQGRPAFYSITFYGDIRSLQDRFGEDELSALDFSDLDHSYDERTIYGKIRNPEQQIVKYPLVSSKKDWAFNTGNPFIDINFIGSSSKQGVVFNELKPAISFLTIIERIEKKYDVTFSRDWFGDERFKNIYLWFSRENKLETSSGGTQKIDWVNKLSGNNLRYINDYLNPNTDKLQFSLIPQAPIQRIQISIQTVITPAAGFESIEYEVIQDRNNGHSSSKTGTGIINIGSYLTSDDQGDKIFDIDYSITSSQPFSYTAQIKVSYTHYTNGKPTHLEKGTSSTRGNQSTLVYTNINSSVPKMKVIDFMSGLIKMHNLIIRPGDNDKSFYINTLDNWYASGKTLDLTPYIDIEDIEMKRVDLYKQISFSYQKTGALFGNKFFENNGIQYGDLKATYDTVSGGDFNVELPFELLMFEHLFDSKSGEKTHNNVGKCIDKDLKEYQGKPMCFYYRGVGKPAGKFLGYQMDGGSFALETYGWFDLTLGNYNNKGMQTLMFGEEISQYNFELLPESLYKTFWSKYIKGLYEVKKRVVSFTAILPSHIIHQIDLNNRILIKDKTYRINLININLISGLTKLELLST